MTGSPQLCFILGAPRSGTTWLQRLLVSSPHVASPQETHLFDTYLQVQWLRWAEQEADLGRVLDAVGGAGQLEDRVIGLPTILEEDDLVDSQRILVDRVVRRVLAAKPDARVVLEKTPSNSLCVRTIDRLCPDAQFLHIVRDPREVMASLRDVAATWGGWAPHNAVDAAWMWRSHVNGARKAVAFGPQRYLEIRYEDLRADTAGVLATILSFLGLSDDPASLIAAHEGQDGAPFNEVFAFRSDISTRLSTAPVREPAGFRSSNGRRPLSPLALHVADTIVGAIARSAGYAGGWPDGTLGGRVLRLGALAQRRIHRNSQVGR